MDDPVEALAHDNDKEGQRQERQSSDVSQAKVVRREIAHAPKMLVRRVPSNIAR